MALSAAERAALPDSAFAVTRTRQYPMIDVWHCRQAFKNLPNTQGLTSEERALAKTRILASAQSYGLDTSEWGMDTVQFSLSAMSIDMPDEVHPNRMPFKGVLTRVDEASDEPPGGATGKRVFIPSEVAREALSTLLGMGVDCAPGFDAHDNKFKIGVITDANIEGHALTIAGFFYALDFPEECSAIRQQQHVLGWSYEAKVAVADHEADPWIVDRVIFTGAAVLYKRDAAYHETSIAARAEEIQMTADDIKKMQESQDALLKAVATLTAGMNVVSEEVKTLKAAGASLAGPVIDQVMPHVAACNACADGMEAAGIGGHPSMGHAAMIRKVAGSMLQCAVAGKLPQIYRDHEFFEASGDKTEKTVVKDEATEKALKAAADKSAELETQLKAATDLIAGFQTQLTDLAAKGVRQVEEPKRKTLSVNAQSFITKHNLDADNLTVGSVDTALAAAGVKGREAMAAKLRLVREGALTN